MSDYVYPELTTSEIQALNGPIVIGEMFSMALYGILLCCFVNFYNSSSWVRLGRVLRWTTTFVVTLVSVNMALYTVDAYRTATRPAQDFASAGQGTLIQALFILFLTVISVVVQVVLVIRAAKVSFRSRWLDPLLSILSKVRWAYMVTVGLVIVFELFGALGNIICLIRFISIPDPYWTIGISWTVAISIWMWCAVVVDVLVSATYVYFLILRLDGVLRLVGAQEILSTIVRLVIQSASYTAFLAVATASTTTHYNYYNLSTQNIPFAFTLPLSPLYALSLFTTLSIRERVTDQLKDMNEKAGLKQSGSGLSGLSTVQAQGRNGGLSAAPTMMEIRSGRKRRVEEEEERGEGSESGSGSRRVEFGDEESV